MCVVLTSYLYNMNFLKKDKRKDLIKRKMHFESFGNNKKSKNNKVFCRNKKRTSNKLLMCFCPNLD